MAMSSSSPQPAEGTSALHGSASLFHKVIVKVPGDEFDGIYFRGCLSVKLCSALQLPHSHEVCHDSFFSAR